MRKSDVIHKIHKKTGMPKRDIILIVERFLETVKESLKQKEKVSLKRFGIFKVVKRKPRIGRNPKTKEEIKIPTRYVVTFEPSKELKIIKERRR